MTSSNPCAGRAPTPEPATGWVFYDGDCPWCSGVVRRFGQVLSRRGFQCEPLQSPWVQERIELRPHELLREVRVLTADGVLSGGADAMLCLAEHIWWARPVAWLGRIGWIHGCLDLLYRELAEHRPCSEGVCRIAQGRHHHGTRAFFTMP